MIWPTKNVCVSVQILSTLDLKEDKKSIETFSKKSTQADSVK